MKLIGKASPKRANFSHKWTFVDKTNPGIKYTFDGETVDAVISRPGEYWLFYEPSIAGGCKGKDSMEVYVNGLRTNIHWIKIVGVSLLQFSRV